MLKYILASASPRRAELLNKIVGDFEVIISDAEEKAKESFKRMYPSDKACSLSVLKASDVAERIIEEYKGSSDSFIIIGADTIVMTENDKSLEKPANKEEAMEMIKILQGNMHRVCTGVTVIYFSAENGERIEKTFSECTRVSVYPMSEEEIEEYISTDEPYDKAGGYAIQGRFSAFIKEIYGDYSNVVGLPVGRLYHEIKEILKGREDVR